MSERNKNRKTELEDFFRYSQDQMSEEERNTFERLLEQEPFDAEAMEGLSTLSQDDAMSDLARLKDRIQKRTTRPSETSLSAGRSRGMWYKVAAAVAVLLVVTSVLFTLFNDRMGQLDRKVAESPELEKEAVAPGPSVEITPIQSEVEDVKEEEQKRKDSDQFKSIKAETDPEVESVILSEGVIEKELAQEEPAREELADIQIEEAEEFETEIKVTEEAITEEVFEEAVSAPAPAMAEQRQAAARSKKREKVEQLQAAGAVAPAQRNISGTVISGEDEQPLQGVIVAVKGSNTGTATDMDGRFELALEENSDNTLVTHYIGMKSKEITLQDQEELLIALEADARSLDEVVVIAAAPEKISQPAGYSVVLTEVDADLGNSDHRSATPVGGKREFKEYIKSNIRFPEQGDHLTRAVVVLNFLVGYDGRPAEVLVLKSPGKAFSDEAIRLLMEGPDWQPAEVNGVKVEQASRIRFVFNKE